VGRNVPSPLISVVGEISGTSSDAHADPSAVVKSAILDKMKFMRSDGAVRGSYDPATAYHFKIENGKDTSNASAYGHAATAIRQHHLTADTNPVHVKIN